MLALAIAAGFAALGQWQIGRAVQTATVVTYPTEKVAPLARYASPQKEVTDRAAGQMVSVAARRVAGDTFVVGQRVNFGTTGYWVLGHYVADNGASVAVALGWSAKRSSAAAAADALNSAAPTTTVVGRYQPTEPPDQSNFKAGTRTVVSIPWLINQWDVVTPTTYGGYIVAKNPPAGLRAIESVRPVNDVTLDWLNLFYAVEWVLFAGFAIYLWYRLVKDAFEREEETRLDAESAAASASLS